MTEPKKFTDALKDALVKKACGRNILMPRPKKARMANLRNLALL
jgi:hypothetical protein